MTIIPLPYSIIREHSTGKKLYVNLKTKEQSDKPIWTPNNWQTFENPKNQKTLSYAIRPDSDLVVIDCDDQTTTDTMTSLTIDSTDAYVVVSDKGEKHFYYTPTDYYIESKIYSSSRKKAGSKIDVLHGKCLVFAVCEKNETKSVLHGSLDNLTPIPDSVVDYLVSQLSSFELSMEASGDFSPVTSYLAPLIDSSLGLYGRSGDYRDIQNVMQLITPSKYKDLVKPDYHPDRLVKGDGTSYIQALTAKLGRDPSVSLDLMHEVITLITKKLWSDPWSNSALTAHLKSIPQQKYESGKPLFVYDPNATNKPLVSMNKYPYMPVYRTLDDEYVIAKTNGTVEYIKGLSNFKKAMMSVNFKLLHLNQEILIESRITPVTQQMETVVVRHLPYKQSGTFDDAGTLTYNTYTPTRFLSIIRGEHMADAKYREGSTPTIDKLLSNLMKDHPEESNTVDRFEQFIAHKLKTLEYSPIVFQLMGNRGTGKGTLMNLLHTITNATAKSNFNASNDQFNKNFDGAMFINEDEGVITNKLIEAIKKASGNKTIDIEGKAKDKYTSQNIATYIYSSNSPLLLAQTVDDRRCVPLSSFTSSKMNVNNLDDAILLETEQWCLKLRDKHLENNRLYHDATYWHDDVHYSLFRERSESVQDAPGQLALILKSQLNVLTGEKLFNQLTDILGEYFHYDTTATYIKIYLANRSSRPRRASDSSELTHTITSADVKKAELGHLLKRDTNTKTYDKNIEYLKVPLTSKQLEFFQIREAVTPVNGEEINLD